MPLWSDRNRAGDDYDVPCSAAQGLRLKAVPHPHDILSRSLCTTQPSRRDPATLDSTISTEDSHMSRHMQRVCHVTWVAGMLPSAGPQSAAPEEEDEPRSKCSKCSRPHPPESYKDAVQDEVRDTADAGILDTLQSHLLATDNAAHAAVRFKHTRCFPIHRTHSVVARHANRC